MRPLLVVGHMPSASVMAALAARGVLDKVDIVVGAVEAPKPMVEELVLSAKFAERMQFVPDEEYKPSNAPFYRSLPKFQKRDKRRKL